MRTDTILLGLLSLIVLSSCFEDSAHLRKRFEFYQIINKVSNGTMGVAYSKQGGLGCVANTDIPLGQLTMRVHYTKSLCPYWLFPFKFEIVEALNGIPQIQQSVNTEQKFSVYVMTFYLMYILRGDHKAIKQYFIDNNVTEYLNAFEHDQSIVETFPNVMVGGASLEHDHYLLLKELGYPVEKEYEIELVFRGVISNLLTKPYAEMIFPWVSSFDDFKYCYGIVMSRGMTLKMNEYKVLLNITSVAKLNEFERKNHDINNYMSKAAGASCIIPPVDLCNHHHPKQEDMRDKHPIILDTEPNYFRNMQPVDYSAGQEVTYTYSNDPSNLILFLHYGFIIKDNQFNIFRIRTEDDFVFTVNQFNLCRELGCLDSTIKDPLRVPKVRMYPVRKNFTTTELANLGRIKYIRNDANYNKILKLLLNDKIISYDNEIKAWAYYNSFIKVNQFSKYTLESSVYKAQKYRNRRLDIEKGSLKEDKNEIKQWMRVKHFELIYLIDISYRTVLLYHQGAAAKRLIKNLNGNINDLKKKYMKK